jgi:hypothetical protein
MPRAEPPADPARDGSNAFGHRAADPMGHRDAGTQVKPEHAVDTLGEPAQNAHGSSVDCVTRRFPEAARGEPWTLPIGLLLPVKAAIRSDRP